MHGDRQRGLAELRKGAVIEIDIGTEARRIAADDGERQRQLVARRAHDRFRAAADADPGAQRRALDRREDALVLQRRPRLALPRDGVGADERGEEVELVLEQDLVLRKVVAEQRKGLDEGPAPQRDLGAPI